MVRALLVSGALQYTSTCLAMPFEVGKLLLQVQWVPRDDVWVQVTQAAAANKIIQQRQLQQAQQDALQEDPEEAQDDPWAGTVPSQAEDWQDDNGTESPLRDSDDLNYVDDEALSDEEDADAYFKDISSRPSRPDAKLYATKRRRQRDTDASGYVMRRSVHDDGARPEFVMPVVVRGGVWEMIKAVGRGKEGWLGLWKGSLTSFVLEITSSTIQPIISSILSLLAPSALTPLPLAYSPYPYKTLGLLLSSHLATGILISPLDLIRTRLIAQSTLPAHRKYSGPWDALRKMLDEEGGWQTAYLHPNLLIPTILDFTLRPLLSLGAPLLIERTFSLEPNTHPISYAIAELAISTASLCITLPIETVRRRLQLQIRAPWGADPTKYHAQQVTSRSLRLGQSQGRPGVTVRGLRTCVETRPVPYVGVVEAIYRILTEETSVAPSSSDSQDLAQSGVLAKTGHSSLGGLRSLYRGFGMAFGANLVVFMLTLVSGERADQAGWAEI